MKSSRPTRWNSTLPAPGKPMGRKGRIKSKGSKLKAVNPERAAKRRKTYREKLAAYKRSETFKIVEARAQGQCEKLMPVGREGTPSPFLPCGIGREDGVKVHHHHKTYARFGGKELPEDIAVLCEFHHAEEESQHPTRRHGR